MSNLDRRYGTDTKHQSMLGRPGLLQIGRGTTGREVRYPNEPRMVTAAGANARDAAQAAADLAKIKADAAERAAGANAPGTSPGTVAQNIAANATTTPDVQVAPAPTPETPAPPASVTSAATEASKGLMAHKGNTPGNIWARPMSLNPRARMGVNSDDTRLSAGINTALGNVGNAVAQTGRVVGGVAKGTVNALAALPIASQQTGRERISQRASLGDPMAIMAINSQRSGQNETLLDTTASANRGIDQWSDTWIPAPNTDASQLAAQAFNALGEAGPGVIAGIATGGTTTAAALGGTLAGRLVGSANAFTKSMINPETYGNIGNATLSAGIEYATELASSKLVGGGVSELADRLTGNTLANAALNRVGDAAVEGLEEIASGITYNALTGGDYSASDAAQDFLLGSTVGGVISGGVDAANTAQSNAIVRNVENAVQERITNVANADVADVTDMLDVADSSTLNKVIATDSLSALQARTANPVNTEVTTTNIPTDIAERFNLSPAGEGAPISLNLTSYEGLVNPQVADIVAPTVTNEDRATVNPNEATNVTPNTLYKYADDIYLRPGTSTDTAENTFTYRGQGNEFFRTGTFIDSSAAGLSNEGIGVYSALTPDTTDLYGPTGKLPDNTYANRGIDRTSIATDYPVGVVLQQRAGLSENVSPLERTPNSTQVGTVTEGSRNEGAFDVVPEGERRIRFDAADRNLVTEVVNAPSDVQSVGLIFGRTAIGDAAPIQYATGDVADNPTQPTTAPDNVANEAPTQRTTTPTEGRVTTTVVDNSTSNTDALLSFDEYGESVGRGEYAAPTIETEINTSVPSESGEENADITLRTETEQPQENINEMSNSYFGNTQESAPIPGDELQPTLVPDENNETPSVPVIPDVPELSESPVTQETPVVTGVPINQEVTEYPETPVTPGEPELPSYPDVPYSPEVPLIPEAPGVPSNPGSPGIPETPVSIDLYRRRDEPEQRDADLFASPGSQGRIYDTQGYDRTFGGLSSG